MNKNKFERFVLFVLTWGFNNMKSVFEFFAGGWMFIFALQKVQDGSWVGYLSVGVSIVLVDLAIMTLHMSPIVKYDWYPMSIVVPSVLMFAVSFFFIRSFDGSTLIGLVAFGVLMFGLLRFYRAFEAINNI